MNQSAPQQSPTANSYYNHLIFDNSLMEGSYFYSRAAAIAPSRLEVIDDRIPVALDRFLSPPNSLRLSWWSQTGGDWQAELWTETWLGKARRLSGDTLSLWCYSDEAIPARFLPMVGVNIKDGPHSLPMQMAGLVPDLPAKRWVQVKIPLTTFPRATAEFNFSRIEKVIFTQGINDGKPRTLYIDEIKLIDSSMSGACQVPRGLTATAYDHHVDLIWSEATDPAVAYYQIYRSDNGQDFLPIGMQNPNFNRYSNYVGPSRAKLFYRITAISHD